MRKGFPYIEGIPLDMALIFLHMVTLQRLRAYDFCSAHFSIDAPAAVVSVNVLNRPEGMETNLICDS